MPNDALKSRPKGEQKRLLAREAQLRRTGQWGPWQRLTLPPDQRIGNGWANLFTHINRCAVFVVLDRIDFSGARHLAISSLSGIRPTWPEMQRIKNEIAGPDASGVEVYPPAAEVVDQVNMYHLWIMPGPLPFGLAERNFAHG